MNIKKLSCIALAALVLTACEPKKEESKENSMKNLTAQYAEVALTSDISHLSDNEKEMLRLLFKAGQIMDELYWNENFGDKESLLSKITDPDAKLYAEINYGPWDGINNENAFIEGFGKKPAGAQFYPEDMTMEEWEAFDDSTKNSQYTIIRRDENGNLKSVWYHEVFADQIEEAASLLEQASQLAADAEFAEYLKLRAMALRTDEYYESDTMWMNVRNNNVDMVIGPIENYTDALFGIKAAHEAFILIKDQEWSDKLAHYAALLPGLQKQLPVADEYKQEVPGADADLAVYDAVYYGGDCNANSKTIAINLPNDERVQLEKGTRKLQLKSSMKAKFDNILVPISKELMTAESQANIKFDAFFANVMFHEVAHGMGIKNTLNGQGTVRESLKEQYSAIEEAKADVLGLFLVTKLSEMGEYTNTDLVDNYATFMAGIFRSVRFGAASAHGKGKYADFQLF
jgi:Peptidase family M49.